MARYQQYPCIDFAPGVSCCPGYTISVRVSVLRCITTQHKATTRGNARAIVSPKIDSLTFFHISSPRTSLREDRWKNVIGYTIYGGEKKYCMIGRLSKKLGVPCESQGRHLGLPAQQEESKKLYLHGESNPCRSQVEPLRQWQATMIPFHHRDVGCCLCCFMIMFTNSKRAFLYTYGASEFCCVTSSRPVNLFRMRSDS
jgi:hypothetical protein